MTKREHALLTRFAEMGTASSKYEVLGHGSAPDTDDLVMRLCDAGHLLALPYALTSDPQGGTRFRVTEAGYAALGRTAPAPAKAAHHMNGRAKKASA